MLSRVCEFVRARKHKRIIRHVYDTFKARHLGAIDFRGHDVSHEEQFRIGMIYDVVYLICRKLMKYRHRNRALSQHSQKRRGPSRAVPARKRYFVSAFNAGVLKHNV